PGTSRPRFCSGHKTKGMVGLKNRPCLFPGCATRPHYGLSMGRPMYCSSHKRDGMVHLLKESINIEKERISSVAERKKREAAEKREVTDGDGDEEWTEVTEQRARNRGEKGRSTKGKGKTKAAGVVERSGKKASSGLDYDSEEAASTAQSPRGSRVIDTSGMAPSVEIRLLQEARESARAEAEASGSGRRPRAPSRKLLEASGALEKNQGAQWMTKEIKEADARVKKELREQRKHFKAAGLKAGEVIEAITEPRGGSNGEAEQKRVDVRDGGGVSETLDMGAGAGLTSRNNWRQLTSREVLQGTGMKKQQQQHTADDGENNSTSKRRGGEEVVSPLDERAISTGSKRSRCETDGENLNEELAMRTAGDSEKADTKKALAIRTTGDIENSNKKARVREGGGERGVGGGEDEAGGKAQCEHRDCSKTAIFGVNGIVRYW
ncbi:unnamed protein product, partial [Laminaria digitata]